MPHDASLISTLVAGLVLAFVFGALASRLRQPPLVGYLLAGVLVGPHTPGFVADQELVPQLAEIGVILLMFGVGLQFSLRDLLSVRRIAVSGALVQMTVATLFGWALGELLGWPTGGSLLFGLALSVASTVVLLKWLQDHHLVETERGKIAVAWLVVEDLAMVLALVLIPAAARLASGGEALPDPMVAQISAYLGVYPGIGIVIAATLIKIAVFIGLMLIVGRRLIPALLHWVAHSGSRELFRLAVLATALGTAFGAAKLFGVSLALGAFFAGMILSESKLSSRAAQESLPLRDAFAVLFFISVGMLFDPASIAADPLPVLATVAIIVLFRSIAVFAVVMAFRHTVGTAIMIAASRAQIGEFSFILAQLGIGLGLMPQEGLNLILSGAIISIILTPVLLYVGERLRPALEARLMAPPADASGVEPAQGTAPPSSGTIPRGEPGAPTAGPPAVEPALPPEPSDLAPSALTGHTVLIGYGRVGGIIGAALDRSGASYLVVETADAAVAALTEQGLEAFTGNAASPDVLALANLAAAEAIVIAIPDAFEAGQIAEQARHANPLIRIIARAHSDAEASHLTNCGADIVVVAGQEIARGMLECLGIGVGSPVAEVSARP